MLFLGKSPSSLSKWGRGGSNNSREGSNNSFLLLWAVISLKIYSPKLKPNKQSVTNNYSM